MATHTHEENPLSSGNALNRGLTITLGIVMVLAGFAAILFPLISTLGVVWAVGVMLIVAGIAQSVAAFSSYPKWGGIILGLIVAVLWLVAGLMLLMRPLEGVFALTVVVAAVFLVEGIIKAILSFQMRPTAGWGWVLFDGIVTVVLGVMLWWQLPFSALWALGTLAGISIMLSGWTLVMIPTAITKGSSGNQAAAHPAKP